MTNRSYGAAPRGRQSEALIALEDVTIAYGGKPAVAGVGFAINQGCVTALIGPSGCGKTSLLSSLNRLTDLLPGCAVTGAIRIAGLDIRAPGVDVHALRRRVGMIFQRPNPFPLSIKRNLDMPLKEHGVRSARERMERIEAALEAVGLWREVSGRLDAPALALSGGQQQRLCLARAICLEPEIILLDEPCSALDPIASGVVEDLIAALRGRYTVVIVTHNLAQARRIADDVAVFWLVEGAGRLIEHGPARQVFTVPRHEISANYIAGVRG